MYLGREPLDLGVRKRDAIATLADVCAIVLGVKSKPPSVWGIWSLVTAKS